MVAIKKTFKITSKSDFKGFFLLDLRTTPTPRKLLRRNTVISALFEQILHLGREMVGLDFYCLISVKVC